MTALFEPGRGYELNPAVALHPEPFGALAYPFGNRRLSSSRGRAVSLGLPTVHVPARPCDSSPLAAVR
jgi:hypothetical protein